MLLVNRSNRPLVWPSRRGASFVVPPAVGEAVGSIEVIIIGVLDETWFDDIFGTPTIKAWIDAGELELLGGPGPLPSA